MCVSLQCVCFNLAGQSEREWGGYVRVSSSRALNQTAGTLTVGWSTTFMPLLFKQLNLHARLNISVSFKLWIHQWNYKSAPPAQKWTDWSVNIYKCFKRRLWIIVLGNRRRPMSISRVVPGNKSLPAPDDLTPTSIHNSWCHIKFRERCWCFNSVKVTCKLSPWELFLKVMF